MKRVGKAKTQLGTKLICEAVLREGGDSRVHREERSRPHFKYSRHRGPTQGRQISIIPGFENQRNLTS